MPMGAAVLRHGGAHYGRVLWCGHVAGGRAPCRTSYSCTTRPSDKAYIAVVWCSNNGSPVVDGHATLRGLNECQIAELATPGHLLLNSRTPAGLAAPHVRLTARSNDSGASCFGTAPHAAVRGGGCCTP